VVKSHGSANIEAFANAIADAALQARRQIPQKILAGLNKNEISMN
jgi:phosphate acyltransferase